MTHAFVVPLRQSNASQLFLGSRISFASTRAFGKRQFSGFYDIVRIEVKGISQFTNTIRQNSLSKIITYNTIKNMWYQGPYKQEKLYYSLDKKLKFDTTPSILQSKLKAAQYLPVQNLDSGDLSVLFISFGCNC